MYIICVDIVKILPGPAFLPKNASYLCPHPSQAGVLNLTRVRNLTQLSMVL